MIGSRWAVGTFLIAIALAYMSSAAAAQHTTVVGIAYGTYEIVADSGEVYELVADEKGSELAGLDGLRVRANGMLEVSGGRMILQVLSYSVLEEEPRYQDGMMEEELPEDGPLMEDGYPPEEEPFLEEESMSEQEYPEGENPEDMLLE
ncbi:MAG TPA: hypothetical protein P5054_04535 [Desulfomonilia bacterium]|nr:hypothetical protein [Desulfomonilia bacterium]